MLRQKTRQLDNVFFKVSTLNMWLSLIVEFNGIQGSKVKNSDTKLSTGSPLKCFTLNQYFSFVFNLSDNVHSQEPV